MATQLPYKDIHIKGKAPGRACIFLTHLECITMVSTVFRDLDVTNVYNNHLSCGLGK